MPSNPIDTPVEFIGQLFVGYFNRAADPEGLNYWVGRYNAGMSLAAIADSFSVQPEATALYSFLAAPNIGDKAAFITAVYNNLFNRAPDTPGLNYWVGKLNAGNAGRIILDIISGAQGSDKTIVENKTQIAHEYAESYVNNPNMVWTQNPDITSAKSVMSGVNATDASVTAAQAAIAANVTVEQTTPPLSLTSTLASVNEGSGVDFVLTANDSTQIGKVVSYAITGIATGDIAQPLTGNATIGADLKAVIHVDAVADKTTEGAEKMTMTVGTLTKAVTINDTSTLAPTFPSGASGSATVSENITTSAVVYTAAAKGDSIVYSLTGTDAAAFNINSSTGAITFKASPDFEAPGSQGKDNTYSVNVVATDADSETVQQSVTIEVTNVNEAPTAGTTGAVKVAENSTVVTNLTLVDPDANDSYTWNLSGLDAAKFQIVGNTVSFLAAPNFENPASANLNNTYLLTATATDKGGLQSSVVLTISVTNVNEAPTFAAATKSTNVAENTTAVGTAVATDVDAGTVFTYSLTGDDAALFSVVPATGVVTFVGAPNFEAPGSKAGTNVYSFNVVATDGVLSATQGWTVTVDNVNEAPVLAGTAAVNVAENTTAVQTFTVTDQDAGDSHTYTLTGADAAKFKMSGDKLEFVTGADFENPGDVGADNVYNVTVTATDSKGAVSNSQAVAVTVTDVTAPNDAYRLQAGADGSSGLPIIANSFDGQPAVTGFGLVQTLDDSDWLQGTGTMPTLTFATVNGGPVLVTPHTTGITNVNVSADASVGPNSVLSMQDMVGVTTAGFTRFSGGVGGAIQDMLVSTTSLFVDNTNLQVPQIIFGYQAGQAPGTVGLRLGINGQAASGVNVKDLQIGAGLTGASPAGTSGTGITTLNLETNGNNTIGTTAADGLESTIARLGITNNGGTLTINGLDQSMLGRIDLNSSSGNIFLGEVGAVADAFAGVAGFFLNGSNATANVTADLTNAQNVAVASAFQTGSGTDVLFTTGESSAGFLGQISTANGNDTVNIGSGRFNGGAVADVGGGSSISLGDGNNTVNARDLLSTVSGGSSITSGTDADTVNVDDLAASAFGGSSISTGAGVDAINVTGSVAGDGPGGAVVDASIDSGDDGDTINITGTVGGSVSGGKGGDTITSGAVTSGSVDGGDDNDTITVGAIAAGAVVQGGAGDDKITAGVVSGSLFGDIGGNDAAGNDQVTVTGIAGGGQVVLDGVDYLVVNGTVVQGVAATTSANLGIDGDFYWQNVGGTATALTQAAGGVAVLQGGKGTDVAVFASTTAAATTTVVVSGGSVNAAVQGIETVQVLHTVTGTVNLDLKQVDADLTRVDILSADGTAATTGITGIAGEGLFLTNGIAQGGNLPAIAATTFNDSPPPTTQNLNVAMAAAGGTVNLTIESPQTFIVNLNDTADSAASLKLAITNTTQNQTVNFDGGVDDFKTMTTVTGSAVGRTIRLTGIDSATIDASASAANFNITVGARADDVAINKLDRSITTGSGDDTVDLQAMFLDGGDGLPGGTFGDKIALGSNTAFAAATFTPVGVNSVLTAAVGDRVIINQDTDVTADRDEPFELMTGVEILQVNGGLLADNNKIFLGNGASASGIQEIDTGAGSFVTVETGGLFTPNPLTVNMGLASTFTYLNNNNNNTNILNVLNTFGGEIDSTLTLTKAGTGTTNLTVQIDVDTATRLSAAATTALNGFSELALTVAAGGVDTITLLDSNLDIFGVVGVFNVGDADNANVTVISSNWGVGSAITFNAGGINDFDGVTTTGKVDIDASSETGAVTITGSANDDKLTGSATKASTIDGGAGDDTITGGALADKLTGGAGKDVIVGGGGDDVISGDAGADFLVGGMGRDIIRGNANVAGDGSTFVINADAESAGAIAGIDTWVDIDFMLDFVQLPVIPNMFGGILSLNMAGTTTATLLADLASRVEIQALMAVGGGANNVVLIVNLTSNTAVDTAFDLTVGEANNGITTFMLVDSNGNGAFDAADIIVHLSDDASVKNLNSITAAIDGKASTFNQLAAPSALTAPTLTYAVDTGASAVDGITNDAALDYKGVAVGAPVGGTSTVQVWDDTNGNGQLDGQETILLETSAAAYAGGVTGAALSEGTHTVSVRAVVVNGGNTAYTPSTSTVITVDLTAPGILTPNLVGSTEPVPVSAVEDSDTGASDTDNITSDLTPTFRIEFSKLGTAAVVAGDVITLKADGAADVLTGPYTVLADDVTKGYVDLTSAVLVQDSYLVSATITDIAGNTTTTGTLAVKTDTTADAAPTAVDLQTASDSTDPLALNPGSSTTDNVTSSNKGSFDVTGTVAGSTVTLFADNNTNGVLDIGETVIASQVAAGATTTLTPSSALADGIYQMRAFQTDLAGNQSGLTAALTVTIDTTAPATPTGLALKAGEDTGTGTGAADNITSKTTVTFDVVGSESAPAFTDSAVVVFIDANKNGKFDGGEVNKVVADAAGTDNVTFTGLVDGTTYQFRTFEIDDAGNASAVSAAVSVTIDTTAPVADVTTAYYDYSTNQLVLQGTFEVLSTNTFDLTKVRSDKNNNNADVGSLSAASSVIANTGELIVIQLAGGDIAAFTNKLDGSSYVDLLAGFITDGAGNTSTADTAPVSEQTANVFGGGTPSDSGDTMTGGAAAEFITGKAGPDVISGNGGSDVLRGGAGNDTMSGGAAGDTFVFEATPAANGVDTITDFSVLVDPDVLDFGLYFQSNNAISTLTNVTTTGAAALTNNAVYQVDLATAISGKAYGGADFGDIFGAGKAFSGVDAASGKTVILVHGSDQTQVLMVTDTGDGTVTAGEVALVGILTNSPAVLVNANIHG